ncbi:MFS transporter [Candidatus Sumerlaeota bacterium]|nr:MFS transporter [Candidatus Sumerlaeota bacterium]
MKSSVYPRLSIMMLLQYAVWGFWLPVLSRYLQASPEEGGLGFTAGNVGWIIGLAGSIGAVTAPFIAGQFADRYFSTERFLPFLLIVGGAIKIYTASQTGLGMWLMLSVAYGVVYMPTLALTNSLAFTHLDDPNRQFPYVRVWGTVGWIAASWIFPMVWLQTDLRLQWMPPFLVGSEVEGVTARLVDALRFSGVTSILYGGFCFFLPHTPPRRDATEKLAFAKAFALMRRPSFAVLVAASLPISVIHQIYFMQTGPYLASIGVRDSMIAPAMTIGQFAEIGVMALLGLMLKRIGFRWVMFMGAMAYFARYAVFGTVTLPIELILASQFLHGFCYACFFASAYIYVDRIAEEDVRHSAQTVFGIIILGLGPVVAAPFLTLLEWLFKPEGGELNYSYLWYTLSAVGLVTALGFAAFFRDETVEGAESVAGGADRIAGTERAN